MVRGGGLAGEQQLPTGEETPERPGASGRALTPRPVGDSKPSPRRSCTPMGWKTGSSWRVGRCRRLAPGLALTPTHVAPPEDEHMPSLDLGTHRTRPTEMHTRAQEILQSSATQKGPHQDPAVPRPARRS